MSAVLSLLSVPRQDVELVDGQRRGSGEFRQFLLNLVQILQATGVDPAVIADIEARLAALESSSAINAQIVGIDSVTVLGTLANGLVQINLLNDVAAPGSNYYYGTSDSGFKGWFNSASNFKIASIPGATYSTVQDFVNTMHSPGTIDGPTPVVVETGVPATPIRVLAGKGMIRVADDDVSSMPFFNWEQTDFAQPADGLTRFYGVVYNAGSPVVQQRTAFNWDKDTEIPLGSAVRFPSGVIVVTANPYKTGDPITNIIQRFDAQSPAIRDGSIGGLSLGETGARNNTLTAGKIWSRLSDYDSAAKNSSTTPMLSAFFNGSGLTVASGITQWDNLNFNNLGTGTLQVMGNNKFANLWFFISIDGTKWGFAYGTNEYNSLGAAANEGVPPYLNQNFFQQALLLGRLIFQKGAATASLIESAFLSIFGTSAINNHNDLAGLQGGVVGEFFHLTSAESAAVSAAVAAGGGFVNIDGAQTINGAKTFNNDVTITGAARRIRADFSAASPSDRTSFQTSIANSLTVVQAMPSGTSDVSALVAYNASAINDSAYFIAIASIGGISFGSSTNGAGVPIPFTVVVGGSAVMNYNLGPGFHVTPGQDNLQNFGSGALRWKEIFCVNPVINTSDATEKTIRGAMTPAELTASKQIAQAIVGFRWNSEIATLGEAAKIHFGLTAQNVAAIMTANGLSPTAYGFLCYETWERVPAVAAVPEFGIDAQAEIPAGSRYGLRYSEVLAFVAAGQEQRLKALEALIV